MATRARIATVSMHGRPRPSVEGNRQAGLALLDDALACKPDLVVLPEAFSLYGIKARTADLAEPLDGPTVAACATRARSAGCYVCCPIKRREEADGRLFNSAVMLDRRGQVCGVYDKLCPVVRRADYTDFEGGVTPGGELPVFELDFGPVGVQICFDLGFEENWRALAGKGARLVLWPSAYAGGFPLQAFAYVHHYFVVSSVRHGPGKIIDPLGQVLQATTPDSPVSWRDVNLDFVVYHRDWNQQIETQIAQAYGERVAVSRGDVEASHVLVEPADPTVTCAQLQQQFGFESTQQYHDRHRVALAELRAGRAASPQRAAHGDRAQYQ